MQTSIVLWRVVHLCVMSSNKFLPKPWVEVKPGLTDEQQAALEAVAGTNLTEDDLEADDVTQDAWQSPKTLRAIWVKRHKWVRLCNGDTGDIFDLRIQYVGDITQTAYVSAVISPFWNGAETTGQLLRSLPVAAISTAYTARALGDVAERNRRVILGAAINDDPLKPLPKGGRVTDQSFLAKVGRQYDALEEQHKGEDIGALMAELNGVASSTAKKWLTAARKAMFLMPVASGRKRG